MEILSATLLSVFLLPDKIPQSDSKLGGISAVSFYKDAYYFLSDDRGRYGEPRIYSYILKGNEWINPSVITLKSKNKILSMDPEGLSFLPWGGFLVALEGDGNTKPRRDPELIEFNLRGEFVRTYPIPESIKPNKDGKLVKGTQNNLGPEGLAKHPNEHRWIMAMENSLKQDPVGRVRFFTYMMSEPFVLKGDQQFSYRLEDWVTDAYIRRGVSDVLWKSVSKVWVLERAVTAHGIKAKIFEVSLSSEKALPFDSEKIAKDLEKKLVLDLSDLHMKYPSLGMVENYEGLCLSKNKESGELLIVSDNNFSSLLKTRVLRLKLDSVE